MRDALHKFKVGQTVSLIPSLRFRGKGAYQIVGLWPSEDGTKQYRVKSKDEAYERVVEEADLINPAAPKWPAD